MRIAKALVSNIANSPLSFSRYHNTPKLSKELDKDYEERTWRERLHVDSAGNIIIPGMMFKKSLEIVGSYLGSEAKIPGQRNATYTKHFVAGVMAFDTIPLAIKKEDVKGEWFFIPSNGQKGGAKRVEKCFPRIDNWEGELNFYVIDDLITREAFEKFLREAGSLIGIGRFRPSVGGYYGRFQVKGIVWEEK